MLYCFSKSCKSDITRHAGIHTKIYKINNNSNQNPSIPAIRIENNENILQKRFATLFKQWSPRLTTVCNNKISVITTYSNNLVLSYLQFWHVVHSILKGRPYVIL